MKLVQSSLLDFLATNTYEIKGEKIFLSYKSLRRDYSWDLDIAKIKNVRAFRTGADGWWNLAVLLILGHLIAKLVWEGFFHSKFSFPVGLSLIVGALACIAMSFIKKDMLGFLGDQENFFFSVQLNDKPETKKFVEEIRSKIKAE